MGGVEHAARRIGAALHGRLAWQRRAQREHPAPLVAAMLSGRSASLMPLAAALPRPADRTDMRGLRVVRVLANPFGCDAAMPPFAREALGRAQAAAGPGERVGLVL